MRFKKPKTVGEILDFTFSLGKHNFKDFFMIFLILIGPIYLIEAIVQLLSGTSFFRGTGSGDVWYQQIFSSLNHSQTINAGKIGSDLSVAGVGLISALLIPAAVGSVLITLNHIRKNQEYTVGSVIKQGFSRYWPMLGSTILFSMITFGMMLVPIIIVSIASAFASMASPVVGITVAIILGLGFIVGIGYLLTRWSFFLGSVVLDNDAPGFVRSWNLTRKRTWNIMGFYLVFYLIISGFTLAIEISLNLLLGDSVLLSIITNVVTLITTLFFSVGYGVMYFDLKIRHDADDLKEIIEEYNSTPNL